MSIINNMPQKGGAGINGIIEQYYVAAGETVNAGDFVEFVNGVGNRSSDYGKSQRQLLHDGAYTGWTIKAVALDSTKVLIIHTWLSSFYLYCTLVKIDNSTNQLLITKISQTSIDLEGKSQYFDACVIDANRVFIAYSYGDYCKYRGIILNISSYVTKGTAVELFGNSSTNYEISVAILNGTTAVVTSGYLGEAYSVACTIDDTTITVGTVTQITTNDNTGYSISSTKLTDTTAFVTYAYKTVTGMYGLILTIEGTSLTYTNAQDMSNIGSHQYTACAILMSSTSSTQKVFVAFGGGGDSGYLKGIVCEISNGTLTWGESVALTAETGSRDYISASKISSVYVAISYLASNSIKALMVFPYSTTSLYIYDPVTIQTHNSRDFDIVAFKNNGIDKILLAYSGTSDESYPLYGTVLKADTSSKTFPTTIGTITYETQVLSTIAEVANGVAKGSGQGGDDMGHKDIIEIYVPGTTT